MQNFPSRLLEDAVNEMASLPGIGKKTALRLVLHLLKRESHEVKQFANAFTTLHSEIKYCQSCHNVSDAEICEICSDTRRDGETICVVEDIRDVMALENTQQYRGLYHVLGGIISPMDGIGPSDLEIDSLVNRVAQGNIKEIIMALSATMEGDTTNFYLFRKLKDFPIKVSTLARGVAVGDELEYADEVTLGRSILHRTPFEQTLQR
jgi:recombination protein RecR